MLVRTLFLILLLPLLTFSISRADAFSDTMDIYKIPVVFHVFHNGEPYGVGDNISDEKIYEELEEMNRNYMGQAWYNTTQYESRIQFVMATKDPNCVPTNGIVRVNASSAPGFTSIGINYDDPNEVANQSAIKDLSRWPTSDYLNIWVVPKIHSVSTTVVGFAFVPTTTTALNNNYFGSVVLNTFGALTHEVAHNMGLFHEDMACQSGITIFSQCAILKMRETVRNYLFPLTEEKNCVPTHQNDAGLVAENSLPVKTCPKAVQPEIRFTNYGSNAITALAVDVFIDNVFSETLNWTGSLSYDDTTTALLSSINLTPGVRKIKFLVKTVNGNTDSHSLKDSIVKYVMVAPELGTLPVAIDFESNPENLITLNTEENANAGFYSGLGTTAISALIMEGKNTGTTETFFATYAEQMFSTNPTFVSEAAFCFTPGSATNYILSYDFKLEASYGAGYTVYLNDHEIGPRKYSPYTESFSFSKVTIDLSNYSEETEYLITFKATVAKEHNTSNQYASGGLYLDNIKVEETAPAPVVLDITAKKLFSCAPFNAEFINLSTGSPMPLELVWEFEGGSPSTYIGAYPPTINYATKGSFDVTLTGTMKDGQIISKTWSDLIHTIGVPAPYTLDFDTEDYFTEYNVYNQNKWVISDVGADGSSKSAHLYTEDIFANNGGAIISTGLTTKPVNIDNANYVLSFDWSQGSKYPGERDSIFVSYCTNICSNTWVKLGVITSAEANFIPSSETYPFIPGSGDWQSKSFSLAHLSGQDQVYFRFTSGTWYKSIYIDNIKVESAPLGIAKSKINSSSVSCFPNPANDRIFFNGSKGIETSKATIFSSLGIRLSEHDQLGSGINISTLEPGFYLIVVEGESGSRAQTSFVKY